MRRKPWIAIASLLVVTVAACTGSSAGRAPANEDASMPNDVLVLATANGPTLVDASSAEPLGGAATLTSPDGTHVYTSTPGAGTTELLTRDAATGDVVARTEVDGRFEVRVASMSGRAVALTRPLPDGMDPWTVIPRARTTIVVADPTGASPSRTLRLDGNFEAEAFSADDRSLFLIQHLPAEAPTAYRVTFLDLDSGDIRPVAGRFKVPPQRMPGTRLQQVFDPIKAQLYTLYTNEATTAGDAWSADGGADEDAYDAGQGYGEGGSYGAGDGSGGERDVDVTFVHVLNLRNGWAFCAGVPRNLWGEPAEAQALATSPDGAILYIVDSVRGVVAEMDTRELEIVDTHRVDLGSLDGDRTSATVSADGEVLYVGSASDGEAVYALDTETFRPVARWQLGGTVLDLDLSTDGERLYAALDDGVALLDPASGSHLGSIAVGGIDGILHVATPAPAE